MATLLSIVQRAAQRIGLPQPVGCFGSDPNGRDLAERARQEAAALARRYDWSALVRECTLTTVAAEGQAGALPADYDRMVPGSVFNRSKARQVLGPLSGEQWQRLHAYGAASPLDRYRIRGNVLLLWPAPPAGQVIAFEYVSNAWATSAGGAAQSDWLADADVPLLDPELLTLGIVWRYLQGKGFDYGEAFRSYELAVSDAAARDGGGKPALGLAGGGCGLETGWVPEMNWPGA